MLWAADSGENRRLPIAGHPASLDIRGSGDGTQLGPLPRPLMFFLNAAHQGPFLVS